MDQPPAIKRIIVLTPGFASGEADLNCIPAMQLLLQSFLKKGIDIQVIALEYPFTGQPYPWHGASVFPCNGGNKVYTKWRSLLRAKRYGQQLLRDRSGSDTVLLSFWLGWASIVGELLARAFGIRHFTVLMGQDVLPANRLHFFQLNAARSHKLIAISAFQQAVFEKSSGYKAAHVIPWGIPEPEFLPHPGQNRTMDVLGTGSLVSVKRWDKWLNVIALTTRQKPDIQAFLIGEGPLEARLKQQVITLGIQQQVHFIGALPRPQVLARMREARVFLHTADFESYGFVLAEAAVNGCQICSTPVGIAPEIGARCAESPEELAGILVSMLDHTAPTNTHLPWTMEAVADRYLQVFATASSVDL